MKKLMFAAAVVACATVGLAEGEIYSNNIVGYAGNALDETGGAAAVTPQFIGVSTTGMKLKDIKPIVADGTTSIRRKIQIQLLNSAGTTTTTYRWEGQSGKTWIAKTTTTDMGDVEIPAGQGLWVLNTANTAVTFQTAGEVSKSDIIQALDTAGGAVMVGNGFPVAVKLKDIVPSTETSTSIRRKIQIQLLNSAGTTTTTYRWEGQSGKTWIAKTTTEDMGDIEIPAGTAMWVLNTANCQVSFRIAAPTTGL